MAKRKDGSFSLPGSNKRPRQEIREDSDDDTNEEDFSQQTSDSCSNSQSASGEVGIIESIQLKNFMCHAMLGPFKFGSNVNFIVGNNGSGKSAVLTALIVGLGGKAIATNRGSSLKLFVKDGQNSADVSITLRNRGEDAFKPELYGDTITVNQHISLEGHRSYKLKSKTGALISSKKEELIAILDHFNIQVDNPVSILTQEMSKQFLQSKNEGDKYKFFMKATQLEQMKEDYSYIMETKTRTRDQVEQGEEFLEELRKQYSEKGERYRSLANVNEMENRLKELRHQIAWAMVRETENEIKPIRDTIDVQEASTEKFVQKVEEWQVKVNKAEVNHRCKQEAFEKIMEDAQTLQPTCVALKMEVQKKRKACNDAEAEYNRYQVELKRLVRDDEQLCKKIEELKSSAHQMSAPEELERQRKIEQLKEKLKTFCDRDELISEEIKRYQHAVQTYKEEWVKLENQESELKAMVSDQQRQLRQLNESKTNRLKRFGQHMPVLCDAIERAYHQRQFKNKPIGPLGAFIHLKDAELALAVEACLKGLISAFCCDNYSDERVLQKLMSECCPPGARPQIIVSAFRSHIYDVRQKAVDHPVYPSVLTALEFDNSVVANCLIDMRGIETILLIKNNNEARKVMIMQQPPRNCREAFTADGDQVFHTRYYSSDYTTPRFLSRDVEADIRHLEKELGNKKGQLSSLEQQISSIKNDIKENQTILINHQKHKQQIPVAIRKISQEIKDLENVEEQQSAIISTLEAEAEEGRKKMGTVKEDILQRKKKMEEGKHSLQEAEQKLSAIKDKIHQVEEAAGPIKDRLSEADEELENSKNHMRHYEGKKNDHLESIKKLKDHLAAKEKELMEMIAKASEIHPERIEVDRTVKSLDTEMNRLRQQINSERERTGDRDEIIRQFQEAKEKYHRAEGEVKNLKKFIKLLDKVMVERYDTFIRFRRFLTMRCKIYFNSLLSQRSFSGKIQFDHKNEKLSITPVYMGKRIPLHYIVKYMEGVSSHKDAFQLMNSRFPRNVQPGEGNKAALDDMKSLSGGERSFSTVCFILSLWSIVESPFRCLDEFDVFMDMINRRIAMDMMLKMADSQRYRQFILLTPQNMSSLPISRFIRILRMQDPERGQNTLNFHQRGQEDEDEVP